MHELTGTFDVTTVLQVIVTQPFPEVGDCGVQLALLTVDVTVVHLVSWYPLLEVGATGVHEPTVVGPLMIVGAGQVVVV